MIYRFKLVSDEVSDFARVIEIDSNATFLDLRNAILDSVGFPKDDLDSFYICDDDWEREKEITLVDMGSTSDKDIWLMEETVVSDLIEEEGQRLQFVFDYLSERAFFIEMKESIPGDHLDAPRCTLTRGKAPVQHIDIDLYDAQLESARGSVAGDMDFGEFGDDSYDESDISSGFSDMEE